MLHTVSNIKPTKFEYSIEDLSESDQSWFGTRYMLRVTNYSWFPTDKLMTVVNGRYTDGHGIGATNGRNMGSASIGVRDVETAKKMLGL